MTPAGRRADQPANIEPVEATLPITVGQFVKLAGLAVTGGEAKRLVIDGRVRVNGRVEIHRGHKLELDDIVQVGERAARVAAGPVPSTASTSRQG